MVFSLIPRWGEYWVAWPAPVLSVWAGSFWFLDRGCYRDTVHWWRTASARSFILIKITLGPKDINRVFQIFSDRRQWPRVYLLSKAFIFLKLSYLLPTFWCLTSARSRPGNVLLTRPNRQ
ncbi:hypothetical protein CDAR_452951 [Caerostris darwini]|uniref:Uncharacterized protein n=1 Tax=Caerostris darwini TaxID=1538125 RepID=A0AAV4VCE1_9ARAC|nr:hypothetical protein CDAR_452951 [Caerostris darwini]